MTRTTTPLGCALACAGLMLGIAGSAPAGSRSGRSGFEIQTSESPAFGAGSSLALPLLDDGERPELVLAQRTIDRQWTTAADPNRSVPIAGWVSEPAALALSAAIPGAGHLYAGERSGYMYALAEVVGWVTLGVLQKDSNNLRNQASDVAGSPEAAASGWSFDRWSGATGEDPAAIEALYRADREAFYAAIANDGRYQAGWSNGTTQAQFVDLRDQSDRKLRQSRGAGKFLWLNHIVSAADALRAARIHNLPLRRNLDLKADGGWHRGPSLTLTLEGRF